MFGAIAGGIASALAGGAMSKLFGGGQKAASGGIQGDVLATDNNTVGMGDAEPLFRSDRKSGSAGMPRPISYAVFCLKKKKTNNKQKCNKEITQNKNSRQCKKSTETTVLTLVPVSST